MKPPLILAGAIAILLTSCQLQSEPTATVVEGSVVNNYTRQAIPGVRVKIRNWHYSSFGGTTADSVVSISTDANGHYQLAFDATATGTTYRADIKDSRSVYDLTDYNKYDYYSATDGIALTKGKINKIDFEATSYVPVKVYLNADKQGASLLQATFRADDSDSQGYFSGNIAIDTARSRQRIATTTTIKVVPNRKYFFTLSRTLVNCKSQYNCQNTSINHTQIARFIAYTDTSTIRLN